MFSSLFEHTVNSDWYADEQIVEPESRKPSTIAVQTSQDIAAIARQLQYNIASTTARAISNKYVDSTEFGLAGPELTHNGLAEASSRTSSASSSRCGWRARTS